MTNETKNEVTTIQETSKELKAQSFISQIVMVAAIIAFFAWPVAHGIVPAAIGILAGGWYLTVQFKIWWNHG